MSIKEKLSLILGDDINIEIKRTVLFKSISIKISNKYLFIKAPYLYPHKLLEKFIFKKQTWIKNQFIMQSKIKLFKSKKYSNNEIFLYLGKNYKLKIIICKKNSIIIKDNYLIINLKKKINELKTRKIIRDWLFERSNIYIKEQVNYIAKKNQLNINSIKIKNYKSRWGSCSINGDLSFNWRLIMAPPKIIKYVIIHELMHLKEHNHSPKYWEHVKSLYPNIKDAKKWLIYNGETLNI